MGEHLVACDVCGAMIPGGKHYREHFAVCSRKSRKELLDEIERLRVQLHVVEVECGERNRRIMRVQRLLDLAAEAAGGE